MHLECVGIPHVDHVPVIVEDRLEDELGWLVRQCDEQVYRLRDIGSSEFGIAASREHEFEGKAAGIRRPQEGDPIHHVLFPFSPPCIDEVRQQVGFNLDRGKEAVDE